MIRNLIAGDAGAKFLDLSGKNNMVKKILMILFAFCLVLLAESANAKSTSQYLVKPMVYAVNSECDLDVDAGNDEDIDEDETVRLEGTVDGDYDDIDWDCSGGNLNNEDTLRPTFDPPSNYNNDDERTFTCTLTAENDCGSDSDTVDITVNYQNGDSRDFRVILRANPDSSCGALNDVDLVARVEEDNGGDYNYTYEFDCDNDGDYERTTDDEDDDNDNNDEDENDDEYTASNLCDYASGSSYTARVRVTGRGQTVSDTEIIRTNDCDGDNGDGTGTGGRVGRVSVTKMVSNVTKGLAYQGAVAASPADVINYRIVVTGVSDTSDNVNLRDAIPSGLTNVTGLQIDGTANTGSLASGINIGTISSGQTKNITYSATVAPAASFTSAQTALTNTATITVGNSTASSQTTVNVAKGAIPGSTGVPTGVGG